MSLEITSWPSSRRTPNGDTPGGHAHHHGGIFGERTELIFAVGSGVTLVAGWLIDQRVARLASLICYCIASSLGRRRAHPEHTAGTTLAVGRLVEPGNRRLVPPPVVRKPRPRSVQSAAGPRSLGVAG
ncbi:MAG: hypothetical protein B7Z44_02750 [Caulobacter sp. 12-67-6]|nr:MAG: hypothetical protein B7Z44_02750 [Caulobacter sp. 12-67-6]OYX73598.1 MAG: hypothetical protein B7Y81_02475 [Caulobacter sp. 32-67-35]